MKSALIDASGVFSAASIFEGEATPRVTRGVEADERRWLSCDPFDPFADGGALTGSGRTCVTFSAAIRLSRACAWFASALAGRGAGRSGGGRYNRGETVDRVFVVLRRWPWLTDLILEQWRQPGRGRVGVWFAALGQTVGGVAPLQAVAYW